MHCHALTAAGEDTLHQLGGLPLQRVPDRGPPAGPQRHHPGGSGLSAGGEASSNFARTRHTVIVTVVIRAANIQSAKLSQSRRKAPTKCQFSIVS